jgi:hypothetical protein
MTDIRIRHVDDATTVLLGHADLSEASLDEVLRLISKWGVWSEYADLSHVAAAQFCIADGRAYFEIVVGGEED